MNLPRNLFRMALLSWDVRDPHPDSILPASTTVRGIFQYGKNISIRQETELKKKKVAAALQKRLAFNKSSLAEPSEIRYSSAGGSAFMAVS